MVLISCRIRLHFLDLFIEECKIFGRTGDNLRELPFVTLRSGTKAEVSSSSDMQPSFAQQTKYFLLIVIVCFLRFHLTLLSG